MMLLFRKKKIILYFDEIKNRVHYESGFLGESEL